SGEPAAVAIEPAGAAISWAIVRLRGFDFTSCPALKSCINASEVTAMVPVSPLEDMFTGTLPGEMNAKIACIMFDIALIGPQLVSPNTRSPTSINGSENKIAISDSYTETPILNRKTPHRMPATTTDPITTQPIGKSLCPPLVVLPFNPRNVFTIKFHLSASDINPPATIKPVAGHITQRSV